MFIQKLLEIEEEYFNEIVNMSFAHINLWELLREIVLNKLRYGEYGYITSPTSTSRFIPSLNTYFQRLFLSKKQLKNQGNSKILAISTSLFRRVPRAGVWYNFIFDPFIINSAIEGLRLYEIPRLTVHDMNFKLLKEIQDRVTFIDYYLVKNYLKKRYYVESLSKKLIKSYSNNLNKILSALQLKDNEKSSIISFLFKKLNRIILVQQTMEEVFNQNDPKMFLVTAGSEVYIPPSYIGNSKILEIQHGTIHPEHVGYIYSSALRAHFNKSFKGNFHIAVWHEIYKDILSNISKFSKEQIHVVGFPAYFWTTEYNNKDTANLVNFKLNRQYYIALILSQPLEIAQRAIYNFLNQIKSESNIVYFIKLHPNERLSPIYRDLLKKKENVRLIDNKTDIYSLIDLCDLIIGFNSTVLEEGSLCFGKPCFSLSKKHCPSFWKDYNIVNFISSEKQLLLYLKDISLKKSPNNRTILSYKNEIEKTIKMIYKSVED